MASDTTKKLLPLSKVTHGTLFFTTLRGLRTCSCHFLFCIWAAWKDRVHISIDFLSCSALAIGMKKVLCPCWTFPISTLPSSPLEEEQDPYIWKSSRNAEEIKKVSKLHCQLSQGSSLQVFFSFFFGVLVGVVYSHSLRLSQATIKPVTVAS